MARRHRPLFPRLIVSSACVAALLGACSSSDDPVVVATTAVLDETTDSSDTSAFFPDVIDAEAIRDADGTWTFAVTLSSPYDTPEQYADAWRVVGLDGTEYGTRILTHDHANEQPFTRSQGGIEIPDGVTVVRIEGRDQLNGWGGEVLEFELPS